MSAIASKARMEISSVRARKLPAALLTSPVSGPPSAHMRSSIASTDSADLMSHAIPTALPPADTRTEEHTSELQSLMRISYAVFCVKKKTPHKHNHNHDKQEQ